MILSGYATTSLLHQTSAVARLARLIEEAWRLFVMATKLLSPFCVHMFTGVFSTESIVCVVGRYQSPNRQATSCRLICALKSRRRAPLKIFDNMRTMHSAAVTPCLYLTSESIFEFVIHYYPARQKKRWFILVECHLESFRSMSVTFQSSFYRKSALHPVIYWVSHRPSPRNNAFLLIQTSHCAPLSLNISIREGRPGMKRASKDFHSIIFAPFG